MKNIFKPHKVPYWEEGLIKWSTLLIGIAIGTHWARLFGQYVLLLLILGIIIGIIATFFWVKE